MSKNIEYIDRESGEQQVERVYGEIELRFLYQNLVGRKLRRILLGSWFSNLNAIPKKLWFSRRKVGRFAQRYDVNLAEAEKPIQDYTSLDDFFCRKLKTGARPLCSESNTVCSPADARVFAYHIDEHCRLFIKGQTVSVQDLIDPSGQLHSSGALQGGCALVLRLAPKDYHRFHFPTAGNASEFKLWPGQLESVHPIALNAGAQSFMNKRSVVCLDTVRFGRLYLVAVGALTVGTIVHTYQEGAVQRGQECGYFRFGGSTVILLWSRSGPIIDEDIWHNTKNGLETLVKYGTGIAKQMA